MARGTRVIYPQHAEGRSVLLVNTNPWPVLVQTWVDTGEGDLDQADAPFVVTPAVFRLEPAATQHIRILHTGEPLPDERESLFWLNLYEIPPTDPDAGEMQLTLTLNTQLKLFYRPEGLGAPDELAAQLQFWLEQQDGHWWVMAHNLSPWHAAISALSVDGMDGPLLADDADLSLPPLTTRRYRLRNGQPIADSRVHFSLIDDAGFAGEHASGLIPK